MFRSEMNKGGFMHGISCISIVESPEKYLVSASDESKRKKNEDDKRLLFEENASIAMEKIIEEEVLETYSCSSSSSIGMNSDITGNSLEINSEESCEEVQSSYKNPLDAMNALEEVLPIRRGVSKFYNGKSKSFASLAEAESIKSLPKPENAYSRRRRNVLACSLAWDKSRSFQLRTNGGGISKRVNNPNRNRLALAVAMSNSATNGKDNLDSGNENGPRSSSVSPQFVLRHDPPGGNFSGWRSFSLADLNREIP